MKKFIIRNLVFIAALCFLTFLLTFILVVNMNDDVEKQLESQIKQLNIEKTERINKEVYYKEIENKYFEVIGNKKAEEIVWSYQDENARLQNTIKDLLAKGSKPVNFEMPELISRGDVDRTKKNMKSIGQSLITFYKPCKAECSNDLGITRSGLPVQPGYNVAADLDYYKIGQKILIQEYGIFIITDSGSAIKGKNRFDICTFDPKISNEYGSFKKEVFIIEE